MNRPDSMKYSSSRPYDDEDDRELYDELFAVASSMECTGLMPAAPATTAEVQSYSEIYDIPLAGERPGKSGKKTEKNSR